MASVKALCFSPTLTEQNDSLLYYRSDSDDDAALESGRSGEKAVSRRQLPQRVSRFLAAGERARTAAARTLFIWPRLAVLLSLVVCLCFVALTVRSSRTSPPSPRPQHLGMQPTPHSKQSPEGSDPICTTWSKSSLNSSVWDYDPPAMIKSQQAIHNRPQNMTIVGLVFYGRARYVDVLDCYLRRNLAVNGGLLDEVIFLKHTDKDYDLDYIHRLIDEQPDQYRLVDPPSQCEGGNYSCLWEPATDPNTMYIKIDDDVVFVADDAIPRLVRGRLDNPSPFAIFANTINTPYTAYMHYASGAIHPYLPEASYLGHSPVSSTWRASELPAFNGEDIYTQEPAFEAPFAGHRWLPVRGATPALYDTPFGQAANDDGARFGRYWGDGALAAQQHYSLLENLERNATHLYHRGPGGGYWDTQAVRYNINFFAIWGRDVAAHLPMDGDDEKALTVDIPKATGRPIWIDSGALVSHFHFYPQSRYMAATDLLDRYRAYANEMVCEVWNKKLPMVDVCPGF